ncbi:sigma-70 family RNA polymerase sigma factor [Nocardia cyriacigeorgica]|uniref:RNA polymerase sigma factor n=1 Tax=Nocardia cyriacigeorgica (strain GUH-2) TaxID=1127134 RepID=H6R4D4_NOCCG|nr:sigma-70 family RNA polymerase sigma factor [Nocardia cyriacigeorgica]CCF62003.1 RNA polymerase principal sigma factor hrdA [Nocardia cyriacigeorgica GUH-2]
MTTRCLPARRTASPTLGTVSDDPIRDYLRAIGRTPLLSAEEEVALAERIAAGVLARQRLDEAGGLPPAERRALRRTVADGARAKEHMIQANLRLVVSIARRYPTNTGMSLLDLVQEGTFGLIRAIEKFDHRRGLKLSTYATWWIRQAIGRALADQGRTIRIPVHVVDVLNRVIRTQRTLSQQLGRDATAAEIAADLEMTESQVTELLQQARDPISLHTPIGEDATEYGALIPDTAPGPDELATAATIATQLRAMLGALSDREAEVLTLRYGLDHAEPRSLADIGAALGVSRERARQIEAKGLSKLRTPGRAKVMAGMLG